MKIKELLRSHELASVRAHKADSPKKRETEFDLISVIAKKLRRIRKRDETPEARQPDSTAGNEGSNPS